MWGQPPSAVPPSAARRKLRGYRVRSSNSREKRNHTRLPTVPSQHNAANQKIPPHPALRLALPRILRRSRHRRGRRHSASRSPPSNARRRIHMREIAHQLDSDLADVSITTPDAVTLRAWTIHPPRSNGDAVILLHGLADNRVGMTGYAQLLLAHGFTVLLPDARAHGASGGQLATYGLLESNDIHQWFDFLVAQDHPHCIFGFAESMGAAELLQSLTVEPALLRRRCRIFFLQLPRDRLRPHGPALPPRPLVRTHSLPPRRRIRVSLRSLEVRPRHAASLARRFGRSHQSSGHPDSRPDRQQHSSAPLAPHPGPQSESSSLGSPQRRSLRSHKHSSSKNSSERLLKLVPPGSCGDSRLRLSRQAQRGGILNWPLATDHCPLLSAFPVQPL